MAKLIALATVQLFVLASCGRDEVLSLFDENDPWRRVIDRAPLLNDFSAVASAGGFDGQTIFEGLVIVHDDTAAASQNAEILVERLKVFQGEALERIEIEVEGRFLLVRLRLNNFSSRSIPPRPYENLLLVHK